MSNMPILPVDRMVRDLPPYSASIVRAAFIGATDKLRATKPYRRVGRTDPGAEFKGSANYVWRMLCFDYVGSRPHSCMPVTADFDIPGNCAERREKARMLDELIKRVESVVLGVSAGRVVRWRGLV